MKAGIDSIKGIVYAQDVLQVPDSEASSAYSGQESCAAMCTLSRRAN